MTDKKIIKACPFCGGEAVIHNCAEVENESLKVVLTDKVGVHCKHCGIATSPLLGEETAIEAWNSRVDEEIINRQKAEIEELNELYTNLKNANVLHCLDNEKDRQLLGEYQNIFLDLGYATEVFDPNLTEIKGWVTRMLWHCKRCDELLGEINHLKLRLKNVNEHELHLYKALKTAKAEAVKEFTERLIEKAEDFGIYEDFLYSEFDGFKTYDTVAEAVKHLTETVVKEMVGENND